MRKKLYITIIIISIIAIAIAAHNINNTKSFVISYVKTNLSALEEYAKEIIASHNEPYTTTYNEWQVNYHPETKMIEFEVSSFGMAPSSIYKGFYYSQEDKPVGFQGIEVEFETKGSGWHWTDGTDNREYTERITENWFWFDMRF